MITYEKSYHLQDNVVSTFIILDPTLISIYDKQDSKKLRRKCNISRYNKHIFDLEPTDIHFYTDYNEFDTIAITDKYVFHVNSRDLRKPKLNIDTYYTYKDLNFLFKGDCFIYGDLVSIILKESMIYYTEDYTIFKNPLQVMIIYGYKPDMKIGDMLFLKEA